MLKKAIKWLQKLIHRNDLGWKIRHGYAPRGRTALATGSSGQGAIPGMVGGHLLKKPSTLLVARHLRKNPETGEFEEIDRREVADRVITTAFVNDIVDNLIAEVSTFGDYKYHDSGTGTNAEDASDTALQTPCGEARTAGTQEEGSQTYEYKSIATHTYAGSFAITEHGLFNAATVGILMDRTVFSAIEPPRELPARTHLFICNVSRIAMTNRV